MHYYYDNEKLIADICSSSSKVRENGIKALNIIDKPNAENALTVAFARLDENDRAMLALRLGVSHARFAVLPLMARLISDPSEKVRTMSAYALMCIGDLEALSALVQALNDEADKVVVGACAAIQSLRALNASASLLALLEHKSWSVRLWAATALLNLGVTDPRILHALEDLAEQPEAKEHDAGIVHAEAVENQFGVECTARDHKIGFHQSIDTILAEARRLLLAS